ncbi:hypothetical protein Wildcat_154 [Mycobacterium phage Wildcat]|uniref:Uncharacterized protein n=4 Tax=Mycobacterium virus Wildcat TaxID=1993859 RepID=Q19XT0_9CAUD|nr:hypothetical protein Wildcat_154 [Mycobacterium phage Wildcat]AJD82202.1 hypothetical protein COSMO_155 [Mycobacterium phage Cosmo]AQT25796.1 hypothetical protein EniyanLRS_147 [Mycobacterium phage EniyanLRS]QGJ90037.1 hypothetical protein PBI_MARYV_140 [Mycobacterium phage MaryV]WKR36136.1 hypothetical protein [Mycobacterium phage Azrael100]ABE67734.1 hypothetical protein Wildcat_154 [Mycobacterium phage Wildcat]
MWAKPYPKPDYLNHSLYIGGWQWFRHSINEWRCEGHWVTCDDGWWYLHGAGAEVPIRLVHKRDGIKRALKTATAMHMDVLRKGY